MKAGARFPLSTVAKCFCKRSSLQDESKRIDAAGTSLVRLVRYAMGQRFRSTRCVAIVGPEFQVVSDMQASRTAAK